MPCLFAFLLAGVLTGPASAQPYAFLKILDNNTPRPDGVGPFFVTIGVTPAYDGQWVVFRDNGLNDGSAQAIWSYNTLDGTFHKLVDLKTPAPGGFTFFDLQIPENNPIVRNGIVIFEAHDSNPARPLQANGLYSVPAAGGPVTKLADYDTADPSGGTFARIACCISRMGLFYFDGQTVTFNADSTVTGAPHGTYSVRPDGSGLAIIADSLHPFKPSPPPPAPFQEVITFNDPAVSGSNVVMIGNNFLDPSTGYNGLYLGSVGGNGVVSEQVNSNQQLPGNPDSNFHTRYDLNLLAFDGSLAAFVADDANSFFHGLYTTTPGSHLINKIADVNSTLPGLGPLNHIAAYGLAVNQGRVLFRADDTTPGIPNSAVYLWQNGVSTRIIGTGDTLDGAPILPLPGGVIDPGPAALWGSAFAFNVNGFALYLAAPVSGTVSISAVNNSASGVAGSIAPGEVITLYGTELGPANLSIAPFTNNQLPTLLAGVRVLINGIPAPLIYVSGAQTSAIVPFGIAGSTSATIEVESNGLLSAPVTVPVTNTLPGIFSADSSGSGQGAILNSDLSYNSATNPAAAGFTIVLFASGLGVTHPALTDGSITAGTPALAYPVTVTIGGQTAQIAYQGPAPSEVAGLYQINAVIPAGTPTGNAAVVITADGRPSQPNLTVAIK